MDKQKELRQIVADLLQVDASQIGADTRLSGQRLNGSLGRSILDAGIRRKLGVICTTVQLVKTYGELEAAVLGTTAAPAAAAPLVAAPSGLNCGVDIEMIESLPQANDYRQADFYRTHFTPAEIDYCLKQEDPRPHFAARWCAKEALKKCDSRFSSTDFGSIEVIADSSGRPSLRAMSSGNWMNLPHALSLSHTSLFAIAFVVSAPAGLFAANR